MMKDFVKVQSSFVINIVENNKTLQANRIKDCSKYSQKTATPNGSTMTPNPFTAEVEMRVIAYTVNIVTFFCINIVPHKFISRTSFTVPKSPTYMGQRYPRTMIIASRPWSSTICPWNNLRLHP